MNINDIKQMKDHYELTIKNTIAEVLNIQDTAISVDWTLEQTTVSLMLYSQNNITHFIFKYSEKDFVITTMSYQPVMENEMVLGIVANTATINLATIETIRDIIRDILNQGINEDNSEGEVDA